MSEEEIKSILEKIKSLLEQGWSIGYSRKLAVGGNLEKNKIITGRHEYIAMLNQYIKKYASKVEYSFTDNKKGRRVSARGIK